MTQWPFSAHHEELRNHVRKFVEKELAPHADEWEETEDFPDWVFNRMGELGFLGLVYPRIYGGQERDYLSKIVLAEEMRHCGSGGLCLALQVQTDMAVPPVYKFGTEAQKRKYLIPAIKGEKIFCLGITEPEAGSDIAAIQTTARKVPGGWEINGGKIFITNGRRAHVMTLLAKSQNEAGAPLGLSLFLVETATEGFSILRVLKKVGMDPSDTAEIQFDRLFVPDDALLGREGGGGMAIQWQLQGERLTGAAGTLAAAQHTLDYALAQFRQEEGRNLGLGNDPVNQELLGLTAELEAVRQLIHTTAWRVSRDQHPVREVAMTKLLAARTGWAVTDNVLRLCRSAGSAPGPDLQRAWRDMRLVRIGGGADEVMREIISRTDQPSDDRLDSDIYGDANDAFREEVRVFLRRDLASFVDEWDANRGMPKPVFRQLGERRLLGLVLPTEAGGEVTGPLHDAIVTEELARLGSGGVAGSFWVHKDVVIPLLSYLGTPDQRRMWLKRCIRGEVVGAIAASPSRGHVVETAFSAARRGRGWVLNGSRDSVVNALVADFTIVPARVEDSSSRVAFFLVEASTPGYAVRPQRTLGWHSAHIGQLTLTEAHVPDSERMERPAAAGGIVPSIDRGWSSLTLALTHLVWAERAYSLAKTYGTSRKAFGRELSKFQVWRHRFADAASRIEATRSLCYSALRLFAAGEDAAARAEQAAAFAAMTSFHVADEGVQVHGGRGYLREFAIQRLWRDAWMGAASSGVASEASLTPGRLGS